MSDPMKLTDEERSKAILRQQAEEIDRLDRALSAQYSQDSSPVGQPDVAAVPRERLFSRKALVGWAFGTLLVVFIIRMVLPLVFQTVKESIATSMKESVGNTAVVAPSLPGTPTAAPVTPTPAPPDPVIAPSGTPAPIHPVIPPAAPATGRPHTKK